MEVDGVGNVTQVTNTEILYLDKAGYICNKKLSKNNQNNLNKLGSIYEQGIANSFLYGRIYEELSHLYGKCEKECEQRYHLVVDRDWEVMHGIAESMYIVDTKRAEADTLMLQSQDAYYYLTNSKGVKTWKKQNGKYYLS